MATRLKKSFSDEAEHQKIESLLEEILENLDEGLEDLHFSLEELEEKIDIIVDHIEECEENQSKSNLRKRFYERR